jgi:hypothetical protein
MVRLVVVSLALLFLGQTPGSSPIDVVRTLGSGPKLYVNARIDDRGPYRCLIDTAFRQTAFDPTVHSVARALRHVAIEALSYTIDHPVVMDLRGAEPGPPIHCIVGAEFFEKYVIRIDYTRHTITAFQPITFRYAGRGTAISMVVEQNRFFIPVSLTLGQRTMTRLERLDTESEETNADNFVDGATIQRISTLNSRHKSGQYDRVRIGPFAVDHVWGPSGKEHSIGTEMLRRFIVTIDAPNHRLILEETPHLRDPIPTPPPAW